MATVFQKRLVDDKETLWQIVKIFHPDIPLTIETKADPKLSVKDNRLTAYHKYDWVCIDFKVKGYGDISLGIDNSFQSKLYGDKVTREDIRTALSDGTITMSVWRFVNDTLFIDDHKQRGLDEINISSALLLLKNEGYTLQSVDEFYNHYYKD